MLGAYILSRYRRLGGVALISSVILSMIMLPASVVVIPLFIIWSRLNLIDNYVSLIITYAAFNTPFCTLLFKGFFDLIPQSLEEAAYIDGASKFRALITIILPISAPGLIAVSFFAFMNAWQELLFAIILLNSTSLRTIPVGLLMFFGQYSTSWGGLMAACTLSVVPILIIFAIFERRIIAGMTAGALKG